MLKQKQVKGGVQELAPSTVCHRHTTVSIVPLKRSVDIKAIKQSNLGQR